MNINSLNQMIKVITNRPVIIEVSDANGTVYRLVSKVTNYDPITKESVPCILLQEGTNGKYLEGEGYIAVSYEYLFLYSEVDALA